jgi:hypothetical protein
VVNNQELKGFSILFHKGHTHTHTHTFLRWLNNRTRWGYGGGDVQRAQRPWTAGPARHPPAVHAGGLVPTRVAGPQRSVRSNPTNHHHHHHTHKKKTKKNNRINFLTQTNKQHSLVECPPQETGVTCQSAGRKHIDCVPHNLLALHSPPAFLPNNLRCSSLVSHTLSVLVCVSLSLSLYLPPLRRTGNVRSTKRGAARACCSV